MIVLVMGVSGVGKSTIGTVLATRLGWRFLDADDYHSPANVAKMASGTPLEDADRWPWLDRLNTLLRECEAAGQSAVLACSALTPAYRARLLAGLTTWRLVYLHGPTELLRNRLKRRRHSFMPAGLLESQLATLEPPPEAIAVDVSQPVERCVDEIVARL